MKPRISMITLGVRDLAAAIEFYGRGLGFPRMESPPDVAFFTLNGTWLGLYGRESLAHDAPRYRPMEKGSKHLRSPTTLAQKKRSTRWSLRLLVPAQPWLRSRRRRSGAATAAISKISMATYGRWPIILCSGWVPQMKTHDNAFKSFAALTRTPQHSAPLAHSAAAGLITVMKHIRQRGIGRRLLADRWRSEACFSRAMIGVFLQAIVKSFAGT